MKDDAILICVIIGNSWSFGSKSSPSPWKVNETSPLIPERCDKISTTVANLVIFKSAVSNSRIISLIGVVQSSLPSWTRLPIPTATPSRSWVRQSRISFRHLERYSLLHCEILSCFCIWCFLGRWLPLMHLLYLRVFVFSRELMIIGVDAWRGWFLPSSLLFFVPVTWSARRMTCFDRELQSNMRLAHFAMAQTEHQIPTGKYLWKW